jgi:hypothetical protein
MAIRRAILLTGLVLAVTALSPASALAKAGGTDRPLRGTGDGITTLELATGSFTSSATEIISHLGKVTSTNSGTIVVTGPGTFATSADFTIVAANGDELFLTGTGTGTFTPEASDTTFVTTITGGTGRFEGASGMTRASVHGTTVSSDGVTLITHTVSRSRGTISY